MSGILSCPWTTVDECRMARERSVAGRPDTIPACVEQGPYMETTEVAMSERREITTRYTPEGGWCVLLNGEVVYRATDRHEAEREASVMRRTPSERRDESPGGAR